MRFRFFKKVFKALSNPRVLLSFLVVKSSSLFPDDERYLKLLYRVSTGKQMDLMHPKTYNEKLNWLKLHDRVPDYSVMVDKIKAKEWVSERIGTQYIIPTLKVWDKPEDVDFTTLPEKFVLKCNHNSGTGMFICRDRSKLDKKEVIKGLRKGLKEDYYMMFREWPYKNVPRRILAEQYMEDSESLDLVDYKFFCFNGDPYMMYISQDHAEHPTTDFYDMNFKHLPIRMRDPNSNEGIAKPEKFEEMRNLAKILSKGIPHLRVDFYVINNQVYFGELTFFHNAGLTAIHPDEWDLKIGDRIILPNHAY